MKDGSTVRSATVPPGTSTRPWRSGPSRACAISGDLPTDVSAKDARDPRGAVAAISARWLEVAACMERGEPHPQGRIGRPEDWPELAPLLRTRAELLTEWATGPAMFWVFQPDPDA